MEIVMCTSCYELYSKNKIVKNENDNYYCPKPNCCSKLVDIDEQIAIVIRLLNLKGYETLYCCSGHPGLDSGDPYIFFKAWSVPDTLPEGWEYEKFDRSKQCTITFDPEKIGYWHGLENLHKWVTTLPKLKTNTDIEEEKK